ncbi:MAG: flotillin family protein [Anaerolineales bacterium]|nr:flotillin family protein [Anaerolineales bacterium]
MNTFLALVLGVAALVGLVLLSGIRFIPNNRVGVVEKRFGFRTLKSGLIALNGETGFQPQILRGGLHYLMPIQYAVHIAPLVTITQGKIGYVFARDGAPLEPAQVLASNVTANDFQDVTAFLKNSGQKGPQRLILREGTYAFNLMQFVVITEERVYSLPLSRDDSAVIVRMAEVIKERDGFRPVIIKDNEDTIGIVTVHDGSSLPQGEIIAPVVGDDPENADVYHNKFQDADHFLLAGGMRGRQLQVLVEGTYYINRLFATVEMIQKTVIDVGNVGVVVSYTGEQGEDLSGSEYHHGELVTRGQRGVWNEALLPGKYPFNTYAGKVIPIPTTNFILKWIKNEVGAYNFDENLSEVSLITKDAFEPSLPLSVVVHIDYKKAPLVIQRFGDIKRLVEQTLDPMVAAYFKNVAQTRTLIQLLQERSAIQQQSSLEMKEKFAHYNLELEEVLIGTPSSPTGDKQIETILTQLRQRQVAEEQVETYSQQEKAAVKERELREAESRAAMQGRMTEAELSISIQSNQGKAEYERSIQQAQQIRALAEAEAEKVARVGIAQALATEEQVRAYGGPQFQVTQQVLNRFAEAIQQSGVDVVPRVVVGGGSENGSQSSNIMEGLLTMLLSDRFGALATETAQPQRSPEVEAMREKILKDMQKKDSGKGDQPKKA